jgi:hypothetical protein
MKGDNSYGHFSQTWHEYRPLIFVAVVTPASATALVRSSALVNVLNGFQRVCLDGQDSFSRDFLSEARCLADVPGGFFDVFASGVSTFGKMGALSRIDLTNVTFSGFGSAEAMGFGAFHDSLTFSAGSKAMFTFDVGGVGVGRAEIEDIHGTFDLVIEPGKQVTFTEAFTPGNPLDIDFSLRTDLDVGCTPAVPCNIHALSDFSDTAILKSVQALDNNGNVLSGVTITSESGFDYGSLGSVPEPPTVLLIALGALLAILTRVRWNHWQALSTDTGGGTSPRESQPQA